MEVSDAEGNTRSTNIPASNTDDEFNFADYDDESMNKSFFYFLFNHTTFFWFLDQAGPDLGIGDIAAVDTEPIAEDGII